MITFNNEEYKTIVCALRTQYESLGADLASGDATHSEQIEFENELLKVSTLMTRLDRAGIRVGSHAHGHTFS